MLGKSLFCKQWLALMLLTLGVSLAQLSTSSRYKQQQHRNTTFGFLAVLAAAIISGFSGVYFEKILKNSSASIWIRNLQMGTASIVAGLIGIYLSGEASLVINNGYFYGYNWIVWLVIVLQAIGGLIVAVVVKYTDNILKGFAASFSMVTSCLLSYWFLDFQPGLEFLMGATLVNVSIFMYSYSPSTKQTVKSTDRNIEKDMEKDQHEISHGAVVVPLMSSSYVATSV
jgi:UDP-sugar transporter A1/2/3